MNSIAPGDPDSANPGPPPHYPPMHAPPVTHPTPLSRKRANGNAFSISATVGAVVWLAVYIFNVQRSVHSAAFVAGASLATALIAAAPVAIVAWSSGARWPLWRYPAFILTIALGVTLPSAVADGPADSDRTDERRTAAAPATVGPWTRDDSSSAKARLQQAKDQWQRAAGADGDTAEIALYQNGGQTAMLLVITMRPGSGLDKQASASPSQAVVDALAGAGVGQRSMADPGPLGGALGCGPSTNGDQLYLCAWAELGMLGTITFVDAQLTADAAAETTRAFRSGTER